MILHSWRCRRAGFTLIEIMIVIAIIAILAGIMVPNFVQARQEASLKACRANVLVIVNAIDTCLLRRSALDLVVNEFGVPQYGWVNDDQLFPYLIDNGYLDKVPVCPAGKNRSSVYTYQCSLTAGCNTGRQVSNDTHGSYVWCVGYGHKLNGKSVYVRYFFGDGRSQKKRGWYTGIIGGGGDVQ